MEVLKQLKQIYLSKNALQNHITLFSIIGLFVLFVCKYTASWANILYQDFFIVPPSNAVELWFYLFSLILILIYLTGYGYNFINRVLNDKDFVLPEFTLEPFYIFIKMIPLFIFWGIYYIAAAILGVYVFTSYENFMFSYVYMAIMICLIPFVLMIFAFFAKNFKYDKKFFLLPILGKALDRTLGDIIFLSIQIFIVSLIPVLIIVGVEYCSKFISENLLNLSIRLCAACLVVYITVILNYLYNIELAKIADEKLNN